MWRRATNVSWWLGVSVYFGGLVVVGSVVVPAIFAVTHNAGMALPGIVSPPLEMDKQAGGEIVGMILSRFACLEAIALGLMLIGLVGYLLAHKPARRSAWVLMVMWAFLAGIFGYDAASVRPKVFQAREQVRVTALQHVGDKDGAAWVQRDAFKTLHDADEQLARVKCYLLLGMILVAGWRGLADSPAKHTAVRMETMREEV